MRMLFQAARILLAFGLIPHQHAHQIVLNHHLLFIHVLAATSPVMSLSIPVALRSRSVRLLQIVKHRGGIRVFGGCGFVGEGVVYDKCGLVHVQMVLRG